MLSSPRDYRPLVSVVVFDLVMGVLLFKRRIAGVLLGAAPSSEWSAFETGLLIALVLGLALGIWMWRRIQAR